MPTVKFIALTEEYGNVYDPPVPASKVVPSWWKDKDMYIGGEKQLMSGALYNITSKGCVGITDAMRAGYVFTAPCDIIFEKLQSGYGITWKSELFNHVNFFDKLQASGSGVDMSLYEDEYFKFNTNWLTITPPGYSSLIVHPFWQDEVPFYTLPGIVDTDKFASATNFPFVIKKNFSGMIKMGTPIGQVIPFKREEWAYEVSIDDDKKHYYESLKQFKTIDNHYTRNVHSVKIWK